MFQVELTTSGQSLSGLVTLDGIILSSTYIADISSVSSVPSSGVVLDTDACGNIKNSIGNVFIKDFSSENYQVCTILFYYMSGNTKTVVAGYSQESPFVRKGNDLLNVCISFDFSAFTNGFIFALIQAGSPTAAHNSDGIIHIEDPNTVSDDSYSVYSKSQIDTLLDDITQDLSNYVPTSRSVNNKTLSSDITLTLDDVADGTTRILPTVNDATLTIQKNSTTIDTFSANASSNVTVNISVPTDTSDLTNGAGFITSADMSNLVTTNTTQTITGAKTFDNTVILTDGTSITLNYSDEAIPYGEQSAPNDNYARLFTNTRYEMETSGDAFTVPNVVLDLGPYYYTNDSVAESDGSPEFLVMRDDTRVAQFGSYVYLNQLGRHYDAIPQAYITQIGDLFHPSTQIYSNQFIKHNGTSSQFLKADGSVDSNSYLTSSSLSRFVTLDTEQTITESKTFNSISLLPSGASTDSTIVLDTYHYDNNGTDSDSGETCLRPADDECADLGDYRYKFDNIWAYNIHGNLEGSASSLSTNRHIDGVNFNGTSDIVHFGECTVAASTQIKDVTIPNFNLNLVKGSRVIVKFTNANSASNPQLRVNTSGTNGTAKPIMYRGTYAVSTVAYYSWQAGSSVEFVFDGINWVWVGFQTNIYSSQISNNAYYLYHSSIGAVAAGYYSSPTRAIVPYNSNTTSDLGAVSYRWRTLYLSTSISDGTNTFSLPSSSGTLALTSDIPQDIFLVAVDGTSLSIGSENDYRDPVPASDPDSGNPRWAGNEVSLEVDQYVDLTANLRLSVYVPAQMFIGSIAFPTDSEISDYAAYPIYFRGTESIHNPVVPVGSVLRLTFRQNAFYNDFYDIADFGVEHEPIVRVGKVPHQSYDSSYNGALVALRRDNNKFDKLLTISRSGVTTTTTLLDMADGSPIYASFLGECFAAHPHVPFGMFLNMEYIYSAGQTPSASNVAFDFITSDSSTIADHIVTKTSGDVNHPYRYFQVDNASVFLLLTTNTGHRISIGGIPTGCEGKLIGFLAAGTDNAGLLRLVNCCNNQASQSSGGSTEYYGVCSTAANQAAKVVTIPSYTVTNPIATGTRVIVKFSNTNTASSPTLKVSSDGTNGTAAYILYRSNSSNKVSNSSNYYRWLANDVVEFIFDGSYWVWVGFREHVKYANSADRADFSDFAYSLLDSSESVTISGGTYSSSVVFVSEADFLPSSNLSLYLGKPDRKWSSVYTGTVNFGSVNSAASTTYAASLQLYNSDTTNYKNGISCTGNLLPSSTSIYSLGSPSLKWGTIYANQIGDSNNTVTIYGSATTAEGLKKTVSSTDYTISLNSSNYWVSNTNILPSANSTSTSTGKDLGSTSYKWRYLYVYQIGSLSYKVSSAYITNLYFGTANSASSSTYSTCFQFYNSDNTDYRNGIKCIGNFLPGATNTYDIGSASLKWRTAYFTGGNSSYYLIIDNSGTNSEPTLRPSTNNKGCIGTSSYKLNSIYASSITCDNIICDNIVVLLEIEIQGTGGGSSAMFFEKGTIISSSSHNFIKGIYYANVHFYTDPTTGRNAYDDGHTAYVSGHPLPTGSFKLLSRVVFWLDGGNRCFVVPAIQVVS